MDEWRRIDWSLLLVTLALVVLGLVMIFSASAISAYQMVGTTEYFFRRQVIWSLIGIGACVAVALVPLDSVRLGVPVLYCAVLVCLALVLWPVTGREAGGAWRWIDLGPIGFQPSEFAKLALVAGGALYLTREETVRSNPVRRILGVVGLTLLPVILIVLQPDVGTAFQIAMIGGIMLFLAGTPLMYLTFLVLMSLPLGAVAIFTSGYRSARVMAFLNPWGDPFDRGYHAVQFFRALAAGGLTGKGLGESTRKMGYLPEPYTDSIVAVMGEELGFLGILFLLILLGYLIVKGFAIALRSTDPFPRLMGAGLASMIALQAFLNLAVVAGVIPTTGVAMPFVSYGGSALLVNLLAVGLLLNISRGR